MREIQGQARTIRQLLNGVKYSIDYYQREYQWRSKQIRELVDDLADKFLQDHDPAHERREVASYAPYFLGSIILSKKDGLNFIVDGQQRLTSLSLLLILLRHLQAQRSDVVAVDSLIYSEQYGKRSFNLDVEERAACMEALFEQRPVELHEQPESVQNLHDRYRDLESAFPEELREKALPYFVDWLLDRVYLVEISAYADEEAYTIFETMNDRGLSLTPTEMLRGFLLANITDANKRAQADSIWRDRVRRLDEEGKEVEPDFFKTWLRSQYATRIRQRSRGARAEDFDRIGTEFHRWLREAKESIGLHHGEDYFTLINRDLRFYCRWYLALMSASSSKTDGLEHVYYNAQLGFTLQYLPLLAPLRPDDDDATAMVKLRLVAKFVDILLNWRIWNFRSIAYSTMQYSIFNVMRDVRGMEPPKLAAYLYDVLKEEDQTFASNDRLRLHQQNRNMLHRMLARLTDFVETQSGQQSRYEEYVAIGPNRYEVEHIWANHAERHTDEFSHAADFAEYRNRIGGLLLLPRSFNASYGDLTYEDKLPHYYGQGNLLAKSLHESCYDHNPGFQQFMERSGLPFHPHKHFGQADLDERSMLYRQIAETMWNPNDLLTVEH